MIKLGKNTKKAQRFRESYFIAEDKHLNVLDKVYKNCSQAKKDAFKWCIDFKTENNGYSGYVISHSLFVFSYGFRFKKDGIEYLCVITPNYEFYFEV